MNIVNQFLNLCLFKAEPSDVPASRSLLQITLLAYFVLSVFVNQLDAEWNVSLLISLGDIVVMMVVIGLLLKFRGFQSRYLQTLIAMAGSSCCLTLIGLPIIWWFYQLEAELQANSIAMILMIALMFWSLMVAAHIFRKSLDIKAGTAAMITVITTVISLVVTGLIMSGVA